MQQSETLPQFVDLNILPEELRARGYPILFVLGILVLLAASLALIPLYQAQQSTRDETSLLQEELELIGLDLALVQVDLGKIRGLQRQIEAAEADLASLNEERQETLGDGQGLSVDLATVVLDLPPGVSLVSVTGGDEGMTLSGQALTSGDVFEYVRTLRKSERFSESRIVSLATATGETEGSGVTFVIEAVR
jgi:Tfp pilus assembly protein PilN